ncbi:DsbA family protein [Pseudotabrizicola sp. L79]|uniref:DsbA family protein n=1 Tax=Pseudotabrizicola sp. L79 TaxID=3118402 RepID=UPI002F95A19D
MTKPLKTSLAVVAVAAVAGFGLWSMTQQDTALPLTPIAPANAQSTSTDTATATPAQIEIKDMTLGQEDAPVTMIEYASYTCPHCATFHDAVFKDLKKDYVDTGKVRFVYREVYFDRYGLWAAMMARCGGDMRYFGIQDILYSTQSEWAASDDANIVVGNLKKIGKTAGMDDATLDACLQDGTMAQALVDHYEANMAEYDIKGTPSIVINGTVHSNMTYAELKTILGAELAK